MTNELLQRRAQEPAVDTGSDEEDVGAQLAGIRSDVDRIVALAAGAFERNRTTNSEDFLRRSRQTGGQ